jgi:hypothetical protein
MPLIAGYAYHKKDWVGRKERRLNEILDGVLETA